MSLPTYKPPINTIHRRNRFAIQKLVAAMAEVKTTERGLSELPLKKVTRLPKATLRPALAPIDERADEIGTFVSNLVTSGDLAPDYQILRQLAVHRGYDEEQRLWLTFWYLAYHHLPSALTATRAVGVNYSGIETIRAQSALLNSLPVTVERRLYHGRTTEYVLPLLEHYWTDPRESPTPAKYFFWKYVYFFKNPNAYKWEAGPNAKRFMRWFQTLPGNNRWSTFEALRLLHYVHGWPLESPHLFWLPVNKSHYPVPALHRLYKTNPSKMPISMAKRHAHSFREFLYAYDVMLDWDLLDIAIRKADLYVLRRYYLGFALDEGLALMDRLDGFHEADRTDILAARAALFDPAYLGEASGWTGIRREHLRPGSRLRILRAVGSP